MRRRKPRVVWIPQTNKNAIGINSELVYQLQSHTVTGPTGTFITTEMPLCIDAQMDAENATATIADVESSGYRLRRIVGKIYCQIAQTAAEDAVGSISPVAIICTAGIIVRRADTATGQSLGELTGPEQINVGAIDNTTDPWVWRRSWMLTNNFAGDNVSVFGNATTGESLFTVNPGPANNYESLAGGIADGPHVDQKTARILGQEERLYLDFTSTILGESSDPSPINETPAFIAFWTDLRVLGSVRTNSGNRRNASR